VAGGCLSWQEARKNARKLSVMAIRQKWYKAISLSTGYPAYYASQAPYRQPSNILLIARMSPPSSKGLAESMTSRTLLFLEAG